MLFTAAARNCVPLMSRCVSMSTILVSACKCWMGVVLVQPVMILSALFCVVWRFLSCVFASERVQAGLA